jgi:hypothetical protein
VTFKGAIHAHSTYSDGQFTLAELKQMYTSEGCSFVLMTDHAESFDRSKLANYIQECRNLSDKGFTFVHGLEYECLERMHILGYGCSHLVNTQDPEEVINSIREAGGISVIAHPKDAHIPVIEGFSRLPDGIEVWNSKYDGQYAPRVQIFSLLARLQQRSPRMLAFYGQDLHWRRQNHELYVVAECATPADLTTAFAKGNFKGVKQQLELTSYGKVAADFLEWAAARQAKYSWARKKVANLKKLLTRIGVTIPTPLKDRLRKVF